MNKQKAIERIRVIKKEADELYKIINAPEKPKLRAGDCITEYGISRIVLNKRKDSSGCFAAFKEDAPDLGTYSFAEQHNNIVHFNVFDLIKDWNKDLKEFQLNNNRFRLDFDDEEQPFEIAGGWFSLVDAEEIYPKLGRMIATYKKLKKGKKEKKND